MRHSRRAFLLLPAGLAAFAKTNRNRPGLKSKIDAVIEKSPITTSAFVGIRIVSLADGSILYDRNSDRLFAPASNTKLFTTALALSTLGPQYRFVTTAIAEQAIDPDGRLPGDLILVGGGDPSLSPRQYPYVKPPRDEKPQPFDTIAAIEELADQIVARGVRSVAGDVVGDDRRYVWEPYPDGWSGDDPTWEYGAPVSALIVNDNAFTLWVWPGVQPGDVARVLTSPALSRLTVDNRLLTVASGERKITFARSAGSSELCVWGQIPLSDRGTIESLAVDDPAVFAAALLRDALQRRGVAISGTVVARHRYASDIPDLKHGEGIPAVNGTELARRVSPPLDELLQVVDKVSQNLHAEVMLREVGAMRRGVGSRQAGQEEMKAFLGRSGIKPGEFHLVDGSGLSRLTLVSPAAITKLLVAMYASGHRERWMSLLPIAGVDGTLSNRFEGHPEARKIEAKTGSLSHVRAMSGYAESAEYGPLAFSIIVNGSLAAPHDISVFLDTIGLKLIE